MSLVKFTPACLISADLVKTTEITFMGKSTLPTYKMYPLLATLQLLLSQMTMKMSPILQLVLPQVFWPPPHHRGEIMDMLIPPIHLMESDTTSMMTVNPTTSDRIHTIQFYMETPTSMSILAWGRVLPGRCPHSSSSLLLYPRIITSTLLTLVLTP